MNPPPRHILVVDDHPLTRKGLCDAIAAQPDLRVCAEAESWRAALELALALRPDAIVLDLNLKDGNGWTLIEQLKASSALPPTLVLSVCDEDVYAQRLLQTGARGYLMKDEPIATVLAAIRKILAGHLAVSDATTSRLLQPGSTSATEARSMQILSDRELQVCEMLSQGLANKDIAARLGISPKTIGTYKARLMEKLGVRTTPELVERTRAAVSPPPPAAAP